MEGRRVGLAANSLHSAVDFNLQVTYDDVVTLPYVKLEAKMAVCEKF